jgi:hypothetical protein
MAWSLPVINTYSWGRRGDNWAHWSTPASAQPSRLPATFASAERRDAWRSEACVGTQPLTRSAGPRWSSASSTTQPALTAHRTSAAADPTHSAFARTNTRLGNRDQNQPPRPGARSRHHPPGRQSRPGSVGHLPRGQNPRPVPVAPPVRKQDRPRRPRSTPPAREALHLATDMLVAALRCCSVSPVNRAERDNVAVPGSASAGVLISAARQGWCPRTGRLGSFRAVDNVLGSGLR